MKVPYRAPRAYDAYDGQDAPEAEKPPLWLRFLKNAVFYLIVAALCLFLNFFVVRLGLVNGDSMEPTLSEQDVVVIWQAFYEPRRGDVIVTDEENALGIRLTKRVIATAGQALVIDGGAVYVDGEPLAEDYLMEAPLAGPPMAVTVPPGCVFVMGDNRNASFDSREMGCLPSAEIMGKVVLRLYPFSRIQAIPAAQY